MIAALLSIVTAIPAWLRTILGALLVAVLAGAALVMWFKGALDQHTDQASATAEITERAAHHEEVLKNVEKAKRASASPSNAAVERMRSKYDRSYPDRE